MNSADKNIPVLLVGGFLGAGKTTLVNHLLRHANGKRMAVLVNDFGDISIDAELIRSIEQNVLHIAGGCICCSYGDDLVAALRKLAEKRHLYDRVLIETSGVSLPYTIACTVPLITGFELLATLVMVDGYAFCSQLEDPFISDTVFRQMISADLIVLNKIDQLSRSEHVLRQRKVQELCPEAQVLAATRSEIFWEEISKVTPRNFRCPAPDNREASHHGLFKSPRVSRLRVEHDPTLFFQSCTLELRERLDFEELGKALNTYRSDIVRAKIIALDHEGRWRGLSFSSGLYETFLPPKTSLNGHGVFVLKAHADAEKVLKDILQAGLPVPYKSSLWVE